MIAKEVFYILVIECAPDNFLNIRNELHRCSFDIKCFHVNTASAMSEALDIRHWDLIIANCKHDFFYGSDIYFVWKEEGDGIPIILVTEAIDREDAVKLLNCGVSDVVLRENLTSLVPSMERWLSNHAAQEKFREKIRLFDDSLLMMHHSTFRFRTLEDARKIADLLALLCPEPEKRVFGLRELFVNAVEHGNLGITYEEKTLLNEKDVWDEEVERRLALPENITKCVTVQATRTESEVQFLIQDQGQGFDWKHYMGMNPFETHKSHGFGIAMAKGGSFDRLEYHGCGNQVTAVVYQKCSKNSKVKEF
ncbi:MAG: ATP-binding protein [Magnetococcales bacterium]|nr:ATP-binding protein [Magnetococcales bacterium]